jgi:hypothetical protein
MKAVLLAMMMALTFMPVRAQTPPVEQSKADAPKERTDAEKLADALGRIKQLELENVQLSKGIGQLMIQSASCREALLMLPPVPSAPAAPPVPSAPAAPPAPSAPSAAKP